MRTRNDGVFFGFFLSHVPEDRFDAFWDLVTRALGWDVAVSTAGPFYWGNGSVSSQETHRDGADTGSR